MAIVDWCNSSLTDRRGERRLGVGDRSRQLTQMDRRLAVGEKQRYQHMLNAVAEVEDDVLQLRGSVVDFRPPRVDLGAKVAHVRHDGFRLIDAFRIIAEDGEDLAELLLRGSHGHSTAGEVVVGCQNCFLAPKPIDSRAWELWRISRR